MINFPLMYFGNFAGAPTLWGAVAHNGTLFCAVGRNQYTGVGVVITSPDGVVWTARAPSVEAAWTGISWNGTIFCTVAFNGQSMTSADGVTWATRGVANTGAIGARFVTWNGTRFLAVAQNFGVAATSADGAVWANTGAFSTAGIWNGNASLGARFLVANYGSPRMVTSDNNGAGWTNRTTPTQSWGAVAANSTVAVLLPGAGGVIAASSADGTTWTQRSVPAGTYSAAVWDGTVFCAVSLDGYSAAIATSSDGVTWASRAPALTGVDWHAVASSSSLLCALGNLIAAPYASVIQTSSDHGVTWVQRDSP